MSVLSISLGNNDFQINKCTIINLFFTRSTDKIPEPHAKETVFSSDGPRLYAFYVKKN